MKKLILLDFSISEINYYPQVSLDLINSKYIAISWLTEVIRELSRSGYTVIGIRQPNKYLSELFRSDEIYVLSNRVNTMTNNLLMFFKANFYYLNLESPLFELNLYNLICNNRLSKHAFYIGFGGSAPKSKQVTFVTYPAEPPCLLNNDLPRMIPYSMMSTNNFKSKQAPFPSIRYPWRVINYYIDKMRQIIYPEYSLALDKSTSITKIKLIIEGCLRGLHLYGKGWDSLDFVPNDYRQRLNYSLEKVYKGPVLHKENVLKNSVFSFAIENTQIDGYITEKIIDCFRFGAIPVYFGAPNIADYFPEDSFVDGSSFSSAEDLFSYLENLPQNTIEEMRKLGLTALNNYLSSWSNCHMANLVTDQLLRRAN